MQDQILVKQDVIDAFSQLGIKSGTSLIVHCSLKSLGSYLVGGSQTIIEALIECVGNKGNIMMPTQSWRNLDPSTGVHGDVPKELYQKIIDNIPAYNKHITPTNTMGSVAQMFIHYPGVSRSDHPARSFAAFGQKAIELTQNHTLEDIFGDNSPLSRLYNLDGYVLLIGVGYDKNTSLHLADARANYPQKHDVIEHSAVVENGQRVWKAYKTLYVDGEDFEQIGEAFEKAYQVSKVKLAKATLRLIRQRVLVNFAVKWIEENRK